MCFVLCLGYPNSLYPLVALACSYWKQDFGSPPEIEVRSWQWDCWILATRPPGRATLVAQIVKNLPAMQETWVWSLGQEDPLEKGMATHSSILAWKIPETEEPGRLQSMGLQRVGHFWATNTHRPPVVSDKALAHWLCTNEFPQRQKVVKQVKCLLGGKRVRVNRLTWAGLEREFRSCCGLNDLFRTSLPGFLRPIILVCLVVSLYLVYLGSSPVCACLLAKMKSSKEAYG